MDHHDNDVSMRDDLEFEEVTVGAVALPHAAAHNFAIKTFKIPKEVILLPSLRSIYFHPDEVLVPNAPPNLQLFVYFAIYNEIATANFFADKGLPVEINRAIWFYGLDKRHSFSRFFDQIRYNVILMAFVWASDFDLRYCKEGCKRFVKAFLRASVTPDSTACGSSVSSRSLRLKPKAWIESLVYQHDPSVNKFARREAFITLWQNSPFEFHYFSARRGKEISKVLAALRHQHSYMSNVPEPANFIQTVRKGELTEDLFEKFGAALTLQWLTGLTGIAHEKQEQIDVDNDINQADLEMQRASAAVENARAIQVHIASGLSVEDEEMADEFDPFPDDVHPGLSTVDRDDDHLVASLLRPVDDDLVHPSEVQDKSRPELDETSFWVFHQQIKDIFKEDASKPEPSRGMGELTALMETTVMKATIQ